MIISRFQYMEGLRCRKLLWALYNDAERIPCNYDGTQCLFYDAAAVSELAHSLFPEIITADQEKEDSDISGAPWPLMSKRRPIFRANIKSVGISARIDVLKPAEDDKWDIIQISMAPGKQDQHVQDIAFQWHCCEKAGVSIRNCYLTHVNSNYIRTGTLDAHELLTFEDVTGKVRAELAGIAFRIAEMVRVIEMDECPAFEMFTKETNCLSCCHLTHWHCPLIEQCREAIYGKRIVMPPIGDADFDIEKIRNFMGQLAYPIHILDLKYFTRVIPIEGCRPYTMLPFVFSLQAVDNLDSEPVSYSWLWDGRGDPRSLMLERLGKFIGGSGSILVRFKCFEESLLKESYRAFPEHLTLVEKLTPRMLELIVPFRTQVLGRLAYEGIDLFKAVLHGMTGTEHEDMGQDERIVGAEFIRCLYGKLSTEESARIRSRLEKYCDQNTMEMLHVLHKMANLAEIPIKADVTGPGEHTISDCEMLL